MEETKISGMIAELAKLQILRSKLYMQMIKSKSKEMVTGAINAVDGRLANANKRLADARQQSDTIKSQKEAYAASLSSLTAEYDGRIAEEQEHKNSLEQSMTLARAAVNETKQALKELDRMSGKTKVDRNLDAEARDNEAVKQLQERIAQRDSFKQIRIAAEETIRSCETAINEINSRQEGLTAEKAQKIQELSESKAIAKQTVFSRFLGIFGRGAKEREEDIRKDMESRTSRANEETKKVRDDRAENKNDRENKKADIIKGIDDKFTALTTSCREAVLGAARRTRDGIISAKDFAVDTVEAAKARIDEIVTSAIGMIDTSKEIVINMPAHITGTASEKIKEWLDNSAKNKVIADQNISDARARRKEYKANLMGKNDKKDDEIGA